MLLDELNQYREIGKPDTLRRMRGEHAALLAGNSYERAAHLMSLGEISEHCQEALID